MPDLTQDPLAIDNRARVAREDRQQVELLAGQLHFASVHDCAMASQVDANAAGVYLFTVVARSGGSPHDRADAGHELTQTERFDEVVVGTQLETDDAIDLLAPRGDDDDRNRRSRSDLTANLQTVHVGQPQVEENDVRLGRRERFLPCRRTNDGEAFATQPFSERDGNRVVVLDEEYIHVHIVAGRPVDASAISRILCQRERRPLSHVFAHPDAHTAARGLDLDNLGASP
jgi:hypothetical protein